MDGRDPLFSGNLLAGCRKNQGEKARYPGLCAPPVGGFSGAEVLDEVLSQLCIWHYTRNNATGAEYSAAWWSYIEALAGCLQDRADGTHEEYALPSPPED